MVCLRNVLWVAASDSPQLSIASYWREDILRTEVAGALPCRACPSEAVRAGATQSVPVTGPMDDRVLGTIIQQPGPMLYRVHVRDGESDKHLDHPCIRSSILCDALLEGPGQHLAPNAADPTSTIPRGSRVNMPNAEDSDSEMEVPPPDIASDKSPDNQRMMVAPL
ncbi:hypothetical protein scyTo_0006756 [Scyliorhinus torazame]|uniref:Uncharacterized protein n=1 Tax=Scyliorhinus torazame TaxID=75743 RepID=A0A401PJV1_SCYTO|nr:hypothetical protein [Scyliorhinus torazame]